MTATDMKELVYQGTTYRVPFTDLFRPLTAAEEAELRASVKDVGVSYPVLVYDSETWGENCVIDGANRLRIAGEEGAAVAVEKIDLNDAEARRRAEDLNIARRRVTPEEARTARERRIERVKNLRATGLSTRVIAEQVGVSHPTILKDLRAGGKGLPPDAKSSVPPGNGASENAPEPAIVTGKTRRNIRRRSRNRPRRVSRG